MEEKQPTIARFKNIIPMDEEGILSMLGDADELMIEYNGVMLTGTVLMVYRGDTSRVGDNLYRVGSLEMELQRPSFDRCTAVFRHI
jgi:hypothetical protein